MKILFINPYVVSAIPTSLSEPLGLISLATYLDYCFGNDLSVKILDLYALGGGKIIKEDGKYVMGMNDEREIIGRIRAFKPDLIGIHCNFSMYSESAFKITALARKACRKALIVMGGAHASLDAENIMREYPDIDFIVRGEGEVILKELILAFKNDKPESLKNINGLCYRGSDNTIIVNPDHELIFDINNLPIPDRKFIDMRFYKHINSQAFAFSKKAPPVTIMTSRGCPFDCIFCSTKMMWKRRWRPLKAEKVMQEIKNLVQNYGAKEICILDDQFILDKDRVHKICDYLIAGNFGISLTIAGGVSIWLIDESLMRKLKQAGFYRFNFPIESGSQNTLKFIRKPIDLRIAKEKIQLASRLGFWTAGNFIIGFPYETREDMAETIEFAYSSKLDFAIFLIAKPFAGSEMTEIFKKEGLFKGYLHGSDLLISTHDIKTMTASQLQRVHKNAIRGFIFSKILFFLNPLNVYTYFSPKLKTTDDIFYTIKLFMVSIFRVLIPGLTNRTLRLIGPIKY